MQFVVNNILIALKRASLGYVIACNKYIIATLRKIVGLRSVTSEKVVIDTSSYVKYKTH